MSGQEARSAAYDQEDTCLEQPQASGMDSVSGSESRSLSPGLSSCSSRAASSAASVWGTWHIETAWGWRNGEDTPELLVAWDYYSYEQNEQGFQEAVAMAFADNQIRTETLRRVTLKMNGDRIMELYETPEVEAEAEASE